MTARGASQRPDNSAALHSASTRPNSRANAGTRRITDPIPFSPTPATGTGYLAGEAPSGGSPDGRFKLNNVPAVGRITVHERDTMLLAAETMSAADGTWLVEDLDMAVVYTVIGWDDAGNWNAAIQDWVMPVAMP